ANVLALSLNVPLTDLDGYLEGRILACGHTRRPVGADAEKTEIRHVLLIDDSISSGGSMREALRKLRAVYPDLKISCCAVYGLGGGTYQGEIVFEEVPNPRMFQWNLMHHPLLDQCCVDIDGVLCIDPTEHENDDGARYLRFLEEAAALHMPTLQVGYLVTSRLEKYRPQTEAWLARHGIVYRELHMLDLPSKEERQRLNAHASFKADVYAHLSDALLFIESERDQAIEIARLSGKPALSLGTQEVMTPGSISAVTLTASARTLRTRLRYARRNAVLPAKKLARRLLGDEVYERLLTAIAN
ncbi:MAG: phosphoribosyltransferase family protein, partial [Polyangiales bacterium]